MSLDAYLNAVVTEDSDARVGCTQVDTNSGRHLEYVDVLSSVVGFMCVGRRRKTRLKGNGYY